MQATYQGDALPLATGTPVEVTVDGNQLTITHAAQQLAWPIGELQVRIDKRLTFDAHQRRRGPVFFGTLTMAERRGEPVLREVVHIDTPQGPVILSMENPHQLVEAVGASRPSTGASVAPLADRPLRRLIAVAILVLIALIIAVISTRPNLH